MESQQKFPRLDDGYGLIGLLITFALVCVILWYSLDFLKPLSIASEPGQESAIKQAESAKAALEARDKALGEIDD